MEKEQVKKTVVVVAKTVVSGIAAWGVGAIVGNLIKKTTPDDIGKITNLTIKLGALIITGWVSGCAKKYIEDTIDDGVAKIDKTVFDIQEAIKNANGDNDIIIIDGGQS